MTPIFSGGAGVVDGQQLFDDSHNLFADAGTRRLLAPDGVTPWIDLSNSDSLNAPAFHQGLEFDTNNWILPSGGSWQMNLGQIYLLGEDGIGKFAGGAISIGDSSGSVGSWDASGNLIAATISDGVNTFASLFDGSSGQVYYAASASQPFDVFFANQLQSSSGSSNVFLQTDGSGADLNLGANGWIFSASGVLASADGSNLSFPDISNLLGALDGDFLSITGDGSSLSFSDNTNLIDALSGATFNAYVSRAAVADNGMTADSGWAANAATADKTIVLADFTGIGALNALVGGAGTQIQNLTQKVAAIETALVAQLLPNA